MHCLIILLLHGSQIRSSRVNFSCITYLKQFNSVSQYVRICLKKSCFLQQQQKLNSSKGRPQIWFLEKVGNLDQQGVWPNPNFLLKFFKIKFALINGQNVMKHTIHKWGSNILSIHEGLGLSNSELFVVPTKKMKFFMKK